MKIIDRALQHKILTIAAERYPDSVDESDFPNDLDTSSNADNRKFYANLSYLEENKLIRKGSFNKTLDDVYFIETIRITNHGLDFLTEDGGLSAILNVVTVKFESETLKAILENKINQSDLDPEHKQSMIDALRELPSEGIKHLTTELLTRSLDNLPAAILLIGTYLGLS